MSYEFRSVETADSGYAWIILSEQKLPGGSSCRRGHIILEDDGEVVAMIESYEPFFCETWMVDQYDLESTRDQILTWVLK